MIDYYLGKYTEHTTKSTKVSKQSVPKSKPRGLSGGVTVIILTQVGRVWFIMQNCERNGKIRKPEQWSMTGFKWEHHICIKFYNSLSFINSNVCYSSDPELSNHYLCIEILFESWEPRLICHVKQMHSLKLFNNTFFVGQLSVLSSCLQP